MARDALVEVVVVADALDPDLMGCPDAGRPVEAAGGDGDVRAARDLPEQRRPALGAEAPPGVVLAVRAGDPAKAAVLCELEVLLERFRGGPRMSGPAPALGAVTQHHIPQRPVHLERNSPADAAPAAQPTSASSRPCRRSRPRCTAAMNFVRLTSRVLRMSSA